MIYQCGSCAKISKHTYPMPARLCVKLRFRVKQEMRKRAPCEYGKSLIADYQCFSDPLVMREWWLSTSLRSELWVRSSENSEDIMHLLPDFSWSNDFFTADWWKVMFCENLNQTLNQTLKHQYIILWNWLLEQNQISILRKKNYKFVTILKGYKLIYMFLTIVREFPVKVWRLHILPELIN